MEFKRYGGDWRRYAASLGDTKTLDLRKFNGAAAHPHDMFVRQKAAVERVTRALKNAQDQGVSFLILHHGPARRPTESVGRLLRALMGTDWVRFIDPKASRQYPEALVAAIAARPHRP